MAANKLKILILEEDIHFRTHLESLCSKFGHVTGIGDLESAIGLLIHQTFNLFLLDWHLIQKEQSSIYATIEAFQPKGTLVSLFLVPDLKNVIAAMKSGAQDILWAEMEPKVLMEKIKDAISLNKPDRISHAYVTKLSDSIADKAINRKTTLFQARREFSRIFLQQILSQQKLRRNQLASLMNVSLRTLHRHLSSKRG